jgi:hypothetical protein
MHNSKHNNKTEKKSPNLLRAIGVKVTLVARALLTPDAQTLYGSKHGAFITRTCVHSPTLLRIEIVCCVREASGKRVLTGKYRIRQQYTDWQEHFGTQKVSVCLCEDGVLTSNICCKAVLIISSLYIKRGRSVTLTTHPHLVPRSRMTRSYTSSPPSTSMARNGTALLL